MPALGFSATIYVPDDYPTIQGAIDASVNGDTVIVKPGTYVENIDFLGKDIVVKSSDGPDVTVIDGGNPSNPDLGSVVRFMKQEGPRTVLAGFTVTNGKGMYIEYSSGHWGYFGGGIYCFSSSPTIKDNIIKRNFADRSGGGIYMEIYSPIITGNLITQNASYRGSGIACYKSDATIRKNTITDNAWIQGGNTRGGGIHCVFSNVEITCNNITGNAADYGGGGIYVDYSNPVIANNKIENNESYFGSGGILCNSASPIITDNEIRNNKSGALYCYGSILTITNNIIEGNTSYWSVGGVKGEGDLINNVIRDNSAAGDIGGVEWYGGIVSKNVIMNNSAKNSGGLRCFGSMVTGNIIANNSAKVNGGGVECNKNSVLVNNLIHGNTAGNNGGGILRKNTTITIFNNVVAQNSAGKRGGALHSENKASTIIVNSIFWNNDAPIGPEIGLVKNSVLSIRYSDLEGGQSAVEVLGSSTLNWGPGMIDSDPLFVDADNGDFHLTFNSPCRGSGDNSAVEELYDFEGDPRIYQGTVDMGADEFHTHLYCTGNFTPGGSVEGKLVGLPGTSPVGLFFGSDVLDPSMPTAWGNFHLQAPWLVFPLVPIPTDGVLVLPASIPETLPAPYDLPMQALIGLNPDSLTNLYVLEVR
jgi:parallel beta-helix repeat protein/predicted outer membrane repeat protein